MDRLKELQENGHHNSGSVQSRSIAPGFDAISPHHSSITLPRVFFCRVQGSVTGIHPSDRQGSYIVDSSPQDAPESETSTSRGWEKFYLESNEVADLLKENNMSKDELLQSLITPASCLARPPISSFHVG